MMPADRSGRPAAQTRDNPRFGLCPSVPLVILVIVLCEAPASAQQTVLTPEAARVLEFDLPPAPQAPPPAELQDGGGIDARQSDSTPPLLQPQAPAFRPRSTSSAAMVPPAPETWDQAVEHFALARSRKQQNVVLDPVVGQAWGTTLFAALAAAIAILLVASPLNLGRRGRRPAPVVRAEPHHPPALGVDPEQSVESNRRQPAGGTDRSPSRPPRGRRRRGTFIR